MENNNSNRNRSYQEDWNQNDHEYDRNRSYQNRNQRFNNDTYGSQSFNNNQGWQNNGDRGNLRDTNDYWNKPSQNQSDYYDDKNSRNYQSNFNQNSRESQWRNNDWNRENQHRNFNRNSGQGNYAADYRSNRNYEDRTWWDKTSDEVASWFGDDDAEQRRRMDKINGPHKGKGPKGYLRSDERITEDINEKFYHDSYVDASDIEVKVTDGEATISGTVDSRDAKRRAEDIAEGVSGVKNVQNHLRVSNNATSNHNINTPETTNPRESDQNPARKKSSLLN